jgi:hypothetical protein
MKVSSVDFAFLSQVYSGWLRQEDHKFETLSQNNNNNNNKTQTKQEYIDCILVEEVTYPPPSKLPTSFTNIKDKVEGKLQFFS